jgi:hypothetical protein
MRNTYRTWLILVCMHAAGAAGQSTHFVDENMDGNGTSPKTSVP